ncbi:glycosyltransferase, partial [Oxalobacteraceae bacterium OM1]
MRILLDLQACQTSGSRNRGIGRYSMSLALAMARQARGRHEIIIALNGRFPDTIVPIRQAFDGLVEQDNIVVYDVPGPLLEFDPSLAWRRRAAELARETFFASLNPDVVHVTSLFEGWGDDAVTVIGHLEHRFIRTITLYDLIPLIHKETYLTHAGSRALYYRKLQALKNAELLLSISEHSRREGIEALQLGEDQVVNISSAADDTFVTLDVSADDETALRARYKLHRPFLMYTGGVDYRKNIEGLIEAYSLLPADVRAAYQLAIVCKMQEADMQRLSALAQKCGVGNGEVVFTGFVSEEDLLALYNLASLFVFPSLHEGFGLPVLEAMQCGTPVVGSNTSSIPEVIGRADVLFNPRDVHDIAAKILHVLQDKAFHDELVAYGYEQAKTFSWEASARRALAAFEGAHEQRKALPQLAVPVNLPRRKLAFFSPLPPEKSGIADYSAELLPELARYYDIDIISAQPAISDVWADANFPVRTLDWFEAHADRYDRVLYQFGNSMLHEHMFGMLRRHPGVIVLHDFFLSGIPDNLDFTGRVPGEFARTLFDSHGYRALADEQRLGRLNSIMGYPCNRRVLEDALGVIVHSRYSMQLANHWYGAGAAKEWRHAPLLRTAPATIDRRAARAALGIPDDAFLVCSFGLVAPTKLNDVLHDAWMKSALAADPRCRLVFVGENDTNEYGQKLGAAIAGSTAAARASITGFVPQETYRLYLAAADMAVQLRSNSRGETSASILDCLAYGLPAVINANGSAAEIPDDVVIKLDDLFSPEQLRAALEQLWRDAALRGELGARAAAYVHTHHNAGTVGRIYHEAIESFSQTSEGAGYRRLLGALAAIDVTPAPAPSAEDLRLVSTSIAANRPRKQPRQLLVDVTALRQADPDAPDGIAARQMLAALLESPARGYRVEPYYNDGAQLRHARQFTLS